MSKREIQPRDTFRTTFIGDEKCLHTAEFALIAEQPHEAVLHACRRILHASPDPKNRFEPATSNDGFWINGLVIMHLPDFLGMSSDKISALQLRISTFFTHNTKPPADTEVVPKARGLNLDFEGQDVQIIQDENGEPLFKANDVSRVLGYRNSRDAVKKHVDTQHVAQRDGLDRRRRRISIEGVSQRYTLRTGDGSNRVDAQAYV